MRVWWHYWAVFFFGVMMISVQSIVAEDTSGQSDGIIEIDLPGLSLGARPLRFLRIPSGSFEMGSNDDASWSWCHPCEHLCTR